MSEKNMDEQNRLMLLRDKLRRGEIRQIDVTAEDLKKIRDMMEEERRAMCLPENYDWKKRWSRDLTSIVIHVANAFRAIENDKFDVLEDAIRAIEGLVESHA